MKREYYLAKQALAENGVSPRPHLPSPSSGSRRVRRSAPARDSPRTPPRRQALSGADGAKDGYFPGSESSLGPQPPAPGVGPAPPAPSL